MLVKDIDGLSEGDFFAGLDKIKNNGTTYLAYTTYSRGNPAKPGMRVRIVIPLELVAALSRNTHVGNFI